MRILRSIVVCGLCFLPIPLATDETRGEEPRDTGIVERAERQLVQLDVSVRGPADRIAQLTAADFELAVGGRVIDDFIVDRVCSDWATGLPDAPVDESGSSEPPPGDVPTRELVEAEPAKYLFYFDQAHLTMAGRARSFDLARRLAEDLLVGGSRAMVASNGRELETFVRLTDDLEEVKAGIDRIDEDRAQWDPFPSLEDNRIEDVHHALRKSMEFALRIARSHQRDEIRHTAKALTRFETVLARFAEVPPPKAVIYFADTLRSNAGEHYLYLFPGNNTKGSVEFDLRAPMRMASWTADGPYQAVIDAAAAYGVRLYTVQAEGLVEKLSRNPVRSEYSEKLASGGAGGAGGGGGRGGGNIGLRGGGSSGGSGASGGGPGFVKPRVKPGSEPRLSARRVDDAQHSLKGLALETGGKAFLNGVGPAKMARQILEDLSCVHLISFDARELRKDAPLGVRVHVTKKGVTARTRGRLVVQSESARVSSKLLASFAAPEMAWSTLEMQAGLVPTGYRDGKFTAMVQVIVGGMPLPNTSWDLGGSLVSRGEVRDEIAGHIAIDQPGRPVVLEGEMEFPPGEFTLVAVGRESQTDQVATTQVDGDWPDPDDSPISLSPIALVQPVDGAVLREDRVRRRGAIGSDGKRPIPAGRMTALIGLVCRSRSFSGSLRVERSLVGDSSAEFPSMDLEFGEDRCVQFRDLIPEHTMTSGRFRYEVRVLDGGDEVESRTLEFFVDDRTTRDETSG